MLKTYMRNTCLLHVVDFEECRGELLADVLYGEVVTDETCRYNKDFRVMTSPIICQNGSEFRTKSGSLYVAEGIAKSVSISAKDWYLMRENKLSPQELNSIREFNRHNMFEVN